MLASANIIIMKVYMLHVIIDLTAKGKILKNIIDILQLFQYFIYFKKDTSNMRL